MKSKSLYTLAILGLSVMLAGCRFALIVSDGGNVQSLSGAHDCTGPDYCIYTIDDTSFSDDFTAVPNAGYEFVKWHGGELFACADSTAVTCTVTMDGSPLFQAVIATRETGKLMPVFRYLGLDTDGDGEDNRDDTDDDNDLIPDVDDPCPLDPDTTCERGAPITGADTVIVGTREWAQPDLFLNLSPAEMDEACPEGACIEGSVLNGYDMTGWRWAFMYELNALFGNYDSSFEPTIYQQTIAADSGNPPWALAFLADGWQSFFIGQPEFYVEGFVHGPASDEEGFFQSEYGIGRFINNPVQSDMRTGYGVDPADPGNEIIGGWFYRDQP